MFHTVRTYIDAVSMYCQKTNAQATYSNGSTHTYLGIWACYFYHIQVKLINMIRLTFDMEIVNLSRFNLLS